MRLAVFRSRMLEVGQTIERYTVEASIGHGGMAEVYRVRHVQLGSLHALKILTVPRPTVRQRLLKEGRAQAALRHPNVVAVTDVLDIGGMPALLMEYVDGPTLADWLLDVRPGLNVAEALFRGVCSGVGEAHHRGLVHRDLKPSNVLLAHTASGYVPKVADFGIVKLLEPEMGANRTGTHLAMGTPAYMAPEQIRDARNVDQRADIWSLGCILYELATGTGPFSGTDVLTVLNAVAQGDYIDPRQLAGDVPERVVDTIAKCLQVDASRRPRDCFELIDLLGGGKEGQDGRPVRVDGRVATLGDTGRNVYDPTFEVIAKIAEGPTAVPTDTDPGSVTTDPGRASTDPAIVGDDGWLASEPYDTERDELDTGEEEEEDDGDEPTAVVGEYETFQAPIDPNAATMPNVVRRQAPPPPGKEYRRPPGTAAPSLPPMLMPPPEVKRPVGHIVALVAVAAVLLLLIGVEAGVLRGGAPPIHEGTRGLPILPQRDVDVEAKATLPGGSQATGVAAQPVESTPRPRRPARARARSGSDALAAKEGDDSEARSGFLFGGPEPEEAGEPAGPGWIEVGGDAEKVALVSGTERYEPGELPAGRYELHVVYAGGEPDVALEVEVHEGERLAVTCSARSASCAVE